MDFFFRQRLNRVDSLSVAVAAILVTQGHWIIMLATVLGMAVVSVAGEDALAKARGDQS